MERISTLLVRPFQVATAVPINPIKAIRFATETTLILILPPDPRSTSNGPSCNVISVYLCKFPSGVISPISLVLFRHMLQFGQPTWLGDGNNFGSHRRGLDYDSGIPTHWTRLRPLPVTSGDACLSHSIGPYLIELGLALDLILRAGKSLTGSACESLEAIWSCTRR